MTLAAFAITVVSCARQDETPTSRPAVMSAQSPSAPSATQVTDLAGKPQFPLDPAKVNSRGNVILFLAPECPISNAYSPEIGRLCDAYQAKGFSFYIVYSDPDVTATAAREQVKAYGYTCPAILDPYQGLARAVGAHVTPEVALIAPSGTVAYRGRIDDLYVALGKRRFEPSTHELRDAMDAILAGSTIKRTRTEAIGCEIPGIMASSENKS